MGFKRMFKRSGRRKKEDNVSNSSPSRPDIPSAGARAPSTSSRLGSSGAVSALMDSPSSQMQKTTRDTWANLATFLDTLDSVPAFAPLAVAVDNLSWFVRVHEDVMATREEYTSLRTQLEGLFRDLHSHFSGTTPPDMTTSMLNLSDAIQVELTRVYDTQDRNMISRYMQADYDLNKITGCYRCIQDHLTRIMLNASLNIWRILDQHTADSELRQLNMSISARYDSADAHVVQRRECTPNTREKVLLDLRTWKNNQDAEKVCWINGMAGTGKTTIANTLCSALDKSYELGASFFCTRLLPECRNVKFILPTIAYHLARFSIPFQRALLQALKRDPDVHTKVLHVQFRRMILEPLQEVAHTLPASVLVVIDALDECDDDDGVEQILEVLLESASQLPIKFLVTSRPEHHIRERIGKSSRRAQLILHELEERMVKEDIETYLRTELALMPIPLTSGQITTLVHRAGVLFIYAATVVRYIKAGEPLERLNNILKASELGGKSSNRTKEIDTLYQTVLTSAFSNEDLEDSEKDRMELVLHTVVCVQEPLTAGALARLLELTPAQVMAALKPFWSVLHLSTSDSSHRVSTLHASFPDYILNPARSKEFACNLEMHSGKLAELCLRLISRNSSQFNVCELESSYMLDEDVPRLDEKVKRGIPFDLLYASKYWATHLSLGGKLNERAIELHDFLSKRLLLWMEVLNLTKHIRQAAGQIEKAIFWLNSTAYSESTIPLARDALRFATMFAMSPVSQSTPHLYVSMLSSWPDYQPISRCYIRQTMKPVKIKGIETTDRQLSLLSLIPAGSQVNCVTFSPNGAFFASCTWDHKILIWDAVSCRLTLDPIGGHTDVIQAIVISPDGTQICSGSYDGTLRIWDPQDGRLIAGPLEEHNNWIFSVDYSPDGEWLISGSKDGTLRIWCTQNWRVKGRPLHAHDGRVFSVAFSPSSSIVAAGSESLIHLWDPLTGQKIGESLSGHTGYIRALAFMPDGNYLVSGSDDHTIRIWDVRTGQIAFRPLQEHLSNIQSVKASPNGNLVASAATDGTIRIWDAKSWTTLSLFRDTGFAKSIGFSPDGSRLVSGAMDMNIRIWEVPEISDESVLESQSPGHSNSIRSVVFSPCGTYIISGSDDMTVRVWNAQNGQPIGNPFKGHNDWVTRVEIAADNCHIFSVSEDRMIHVWDSQTGELKNRIGPIETDGDYAADYQELWPTAFSVDGRWVACGSKSGRVYIWDDNSLIYELTGHSNAVHSVALSPDGQSLVSGDDVGFLILWNASSGEKLFGPFKAHSGCINSVALSLHRSLVASGSDDCTVRLWDTHTGAPIGGVYEGHVGRVRSVAFCPQGKQLASGSEDMTVRLWDIKSGGAIAIFEGHTDSVYSVAFSPDGAHIASGSADMTIRVWDAHIPIDRPPAGRECKHRADRPASIKEDNQALGWTMAETGWVQDNECRKLLWVPPDLRTALVRSQNTILISRQGRIELDFSDARIGDAWVKCYKPFPPATES